MGNEQKWYNFGLLISGVLLCLGSFTSWVTVLIVSVSGLDSWRGVPVLGFGMACLALGGSGISPRLMSSALKKGVAGFSVVSLAASIFALGEIALRTRQARIDLSTVPSASGLGGISNAFSDLVSGIAEAARPSLGVGWYLSALGVVVAAISLSSATFGSRDDESVEERETS